MFPSGPRERNQNPSTAEAAVERRVRKGTQRHRDRDMPSALGTRTLVFVYRHRLHKPENPGWQNWEGNDDEN